MIQTILFDFFGTLVAYSESRVVQGYHSTHRLMLDNGLNLSYPAFLESWVAVFDELDRWSRRTGLEFPMERVGTQFLARVGARDQSDDFAAQLSSSYVREWSAAISYIPGVRELLADLSSGARLGIVTNTHSASLIHTQLAASGIAPYMAVVVTSIEHGRPKPHPSIFAAARERLGCPAQSTLFVGDSYAADYFGAKAAGLAALLIYPSGSAPVPAHERIQSVLDVKGRIPEEFPHAIEGRTTAG